MFHSQPGAVGSSRPVWKQISEQLMDESDGPADESSALITVFSGQNLNVYPNGRLSEPNQEMIYSCIGGGYL